MKTRLESFRPPRRKSILLNRIPGRLKTQRRGPRATAIQFIYAHFSPPVIFSVTERCGHVPKLDERHSHPGSAGYARRSALIKLLAPTNIEHRPGAAGPAGQNPALDETSSLRSHECQPSAPANSHP